MISLTPDDRRTQFRVGPISPPPTPIGAERFSPMPMSAPPWVEAIGTLRLTRPFLIEALLPAPAMSRRGHAP
jgi:hypothetical protein